MSPVLPALGLRLVAVAAVFVPAAVLQAASGLQGTQARPGVLLAALVLVAFALALFSASLRLARRVRAPGRGARLLRAGAIGLTAAASVALAFVPLVLALRLAGWLVTSLRYTLAMPEQFIYAIALHPASGLAALALAGLASVWAWRAMPPASP